MIKIGLPRSFPLVFLVVRFSLVKKELIRHG
ncbi:hypothetical protein KPSA3_00942 [Pseudomonas syringae pv. actinidiae]|uniref:Uncharacterized protein n=1 Tax=Pseudomonas syringae pv. actinidiae TaxID=103796 RepID=A0AAN4Q0G0_PSESF|nr:hypothetical protein KPSA3_00942 [Pseudomonas syringae pv. actinidiae]